MTTPMGWGWRVWWLREREFLPIKLNCRKDLRDYRHDPFDLEEGDTEAH